MDDEDEVSRLKAIIAKRLNKARGQSKNGGSNISAPAQGSRGGPIQPVVLMTTGRGGMMMPAQGQGVERDRQALSGKIRRTRETADTHDPNGKRMRYFGDDDDRSNLAEMVERERLGLDKNPEEIFGQLSSRFMGTADDDYTMDDMFVDRAGRKAAKGKLENRDRQRSLNEHKRTSKALESDPYSYENFSKKNKHLLLSLGDKIYMAMPPRGALGRDHVILVPVQHTVSCTAMDEDVWDELVQFQQCLVKMWGDQQKEVVFMESVKYLKKARHTVIHCIALDATTSSDGEGSPGLRESPAELAPLFFKASLWPISLRSFLSSFLKDN
jgi:hypothetical protein